MTLQPVLNFLSRWVVDGRFGEMVCEVMGLLLGESDGDTGEKAKSFALHEDESCGSCNANLPVFPCCPFPSILRSLHCYTDIYGDVLGQSRLIDDLINKMQSKVRGELRFQRELKGLSGALEMVMNQVSVYMEQRRVLGLVELC